MNWNGDSRDPCNDRCPSEALVEQLAESEGVEPWELELTLYDYVDPDALDSLFRPGSGGGYVVFEIDGRVAFLDSDGTVQVFDSDLATVRPSADASAADLLNDIGRWRYR